jgi:hypothetical protein
MPGGAFSSVRPPAGAVTHCCSLTNRGHCFFAQVDDEARIIFEDTLRRNADGRVRAYPFWIDMRRTMEFISQSLEGTRRFFGDNKVEKPQHLQVSIGLVDVAGFRMFISGRDIKNSPYLDSVFRHDETLHYGEFQAGVKPLLDRLEREIQYGFDIAG